MTDSSTRAKIGVSLSIFHLTTKAAVHVFILINWKGCGVAQMKFRAPSSGIPSFLHRQALNELGTLFRLEHILTGDRLGGYVTRLSPQERVEARTPLENQHSQLRQRIIGYLEGAYGIAKPEPGSLSETLKLEEREHFETLDPSFELMPPVGANLKDSFEHLLDQALSHQFPAHPKFEPEARISASVLKKVLIVIDQATQIEDGRVIVDREMRKDMRLIANPLKLGEMSEIPFVLGVHWKNHLLKKEAEHQTDMTVGSLRRWIRRTTTNGITERTSESDHPDIRGTDRSLIRPVWWAVLTDSGGHSRMNSNSANNDCRRRRNGMRQPPEARRYSE